MRPLLLLFFLACLTSGCFTNRYASNKPTVSGGVQNDVVDSPTVIPDSCKTSYTNTSIKKTRELNYFNGLDSERRHGHFFSVRIRNLRNGVTVEAELDTVYSVPNPQLNICVLYTDGQKFCFNINYFPDILLCEKVIQDSTGWALFKYRFNDIFLYNYYRSQYFQKIQKVIPTDMRKFEGNYEPYNYSQDTRFSYKSYNIKNLMNIPGVLETYTGDFIDNQNDDYIFNIFNDPFNAKIPIGTLPFLVYFSNNKMQQECYTHYIAAQKTNGQCTWNIAIEPSWLPWRDGKCWCNIQCK